MDRGGREIYGTYEDSASFVRLSNLLTSTVDHAVRELVHLVHSLAVAALWTDVQQSLNWKERVYESLREMHLRSIESLGERNIRQTRRDSAQFHPERHFANAVQCHARRQALFVQRSIDTVNCTSLESCHPKPAD